MPKPTFSLDDPVWVGEVCIKDVTDINMRNNLGSFLKLVKDVPFAEAKKAVEDFLEERYPGQWYDTFANEDPLKAPPYYDLRGHIVWLNPGMVYLNNDSSYAIRSYYGRIRKSAKSMYALLQELAPDDPRVQAIVHYIETGENS